MPKFTVVYVKGKVAIKGSNVLFEPAPGKSMYEVDAPDRVEAFKSAYRHLAQFGLEIFVAKEPELTGTALGFTDTEISHLREADVPLQTDKTSGIRIDKIIKNL
jgi:hypothetical protein